MERQKAKAVLEAVLFTMGESVEIDRLAEVIEEEKETTKEILDEMAQEYRNGERGIELTTLENAVQLCTKGEYYEYLIKIATTPKKFVLTDTLLETLSIIAYKQPITRLEIEKVRGVSCDHAVNRLLEFGGVGSTAAVTTGYLMYCIYLRRIYINEEEWIRINICAFFIRIYTGIRSRNGFTGRNSAKRKEEGFFSVIV